MQENKYEALNITQIDKKESDRFYTKWIGLIFAAFFLWKGISSIICGFWPKKGSADVFAQVFEIYQARKNGSIVRRKPLNYTFITTRDPSTYLRIKYDFPGYYKVKNGIHNGDTIRVLLSSDCYKNGGPCLPISIRKGSEEYLRESDFVLHSKIWGGIYLSFSLPLLFLAFIKFKKEGFGRPKTFYE
jgi:hypothetical protein